MLNQESLAPLQSALRDAGVDGWLLYDFRGINAIASGLVGIKGFVSRRWFVWVPAQGTPVAITHVIEQNPWHDWPAAWENRQYVAWPVLEAEVAHCVKGKRIVMEYSPGDAVPYVDYVPAGILEMVRAAGATVECSGDLVTRCLAVWNDEERWIEMRLRSQRAQRVSIGALALDVRFAEGEDLLTEISAKFTRQQVRDELSAGGFVVEETWTDPAGDFMLTLARPYC